MVVASSVLPIHEPLLQSITTPQENQIHENLHEFEDVDSPGSCFTSFSRAEDAEIEIRVAEGEFDSFTFSTPGKPAQLWEVEFDGTYTGSVNLTF